MNKKRSYIYFICVSFLLLLVSCYTVYNFKTMKKFNELNIPYSFDFSSKDPQKNADGWTTSITRQIQTTLVSINQKDELENANAQNIQITNSNKTYKITLNHDYEYEDGVKIKAKDYVFAIKHLLDKNLKSEYASWATDNIVGAKEFYNKQAKQIEGLKVISDDKFEINLIKANPYFLNLLSSNVFSPLREDYYNKYLNDYGTSWDKVLSSGLYKIKVFKKGEKIQLVINDKSPKSKMLKKQQINFIKVNSKLSEYNLFKQNELTTYTEIKNMDNLDEKFKDIDKMEMNYLIPNSKTTSKELRKAVDLALDKKYIVEKLLGGYGIYTQTIYPNNFNKNFTFENKNNFNFNLAKDMVSKLNDKEKNLNLLVPNTFNKEVVKYVYTQMQNLGLHVNINTTLPKLVNKEVYLKANTNRKYDFAINTWNANYNHINTYTNELINENSNYINKNDPILTKKMENYNSDMNNYINDNAYLIPLYQTREKMYYRQNIKVYSNGGYFLNVMYWNK